MCADCVEHGAHVGRELREQITKRDIDELPDSELDRIIKRYNIHVPKGLASTSREEKIRLIIGASRRYGAFFPFDKFSKTPEGIKRRVNALGATLTWTLYNNAVRQTAPNLMQPEAYLQWITRPDLSKTGPCPICAPRHGSVYDPDGFVPDMPAHIGCVCEWQIVYLFE